MTNQAIESEDKPVVAVITIRCPFCEEAVTIQKGAEFGTCSNCGMEFAVVGDKPI